MKKHIVLILCVSLLSTLLFGCSSQTKETAQYDTPLYSIAAKSGQYTLTPKATLSDIDACIALDFPSFQSVAEMRQGILTGSFTELELFSLLRSSPSTDGGIEICDLDHLYESTAPADLDAYSISWRGSYYRFHFLSEMASGYISCHNEEQYTEHFNKRYKNFLSNPLETFIRQEELDERSATAYYTNTNVAELKYICYEIRVENKHLFIQEEYLLEHEDDQQPVSSEIPSVVYIWGTNNGGYFRGLFTNFTERPSVEWLSEFGLTPYEGN